MPTQARTARRSGTLRETAGAFARGARVAMGRACAQLGKKLARLPGGKLLRWRLLRWLLVPIVPVLALNLAVGFFGHSLVFPLSPFFLRQKAAALGLYFLHRPTCLVSGHPDLGPLITQAERKHHLPRGLLAAIIEVESHGRVHRISAAGAMGPGQLMRNTARSLGVSDPFDPVENIDASARYLATQWHTFHDVRLVAAAYNAGPGAIVHRRVPHNGETENYVVRVVRTMEAHAPKPVARNSTEFSQKRQRPVSPPSKKAASP